ncbi:sigma-54-dependent Fis family transcriptional regulator [Megalodesulfovibrio gigas]|uniref:sigma-54-dependent Fis family transcriptional regulator n=2 Tax=Megalodesulfovibrio gigas TaxID=879 RepID=UPI00040A6C67|nr:sigma-54-dependent Fis family transcriptional regulator [Megalodesulfovibrio gigas]
MACILVVDDEESIRITFRAFLEREGHTVHVAEGYEQARRFLDHTVPDLLYLDILLRGPSGLELLKHVRERQFSCLVVVITGEPSLESATEALRLGAHDYISKPINRDSLLHSARVTLKHKALQDEKRQLEAEKEWLRLHLEAMFQSISSAVITFDQDMRVIRANAATRTILGLDPDRLPGQLCALALGERHEAFCDVVRRTLRQAPVREFRVELPANGRPAQSLVLDCSPMQDAQRRHLGAVLLARDITRLAGLERALKERTSFRKIIGKSKEMQEIFQLVEDLSKTDTSVLITGPSGTGKELVAEALHANGPRASQQLVKVNCSALSENLLESELFGHVRGAFTGAVRDKVGRFRLAHRGTIFLDEIGDVSPKIQLNLLRVLQEKEFERVGDTETIKVDVRVIAATNVDLREKVRRGEFREDLFYRLKVVELQLPALKNRREDIPLLLDHFMALFSRQLGKHIHEVAEEVQTVFMDYHWPGNIREFRHAIEHAFILCRSNRIELEHLPREIREAALPITAACAGALPLLDESSLRDALVRTGGNKAKAARLLGISRQTIYRKLEEFGLQE